MRKIAFDTHWRMARIHDMGSLYPKGLPDSRAASALPTGVVLALVGTKIVLSLLHDGPGAAGGGYSGVLLVSLEITIGLLLAQAMWRKR